MPIPERFLERPSPVSLDDAVAIMKWLEEYYSEAANSKNGCPYET